MVVWLTSNPLSTLPSQLSRIVISQMDWTSCRLRWQHHQTVALAIAEAGFKFAPDSISDGFLEESVRQVSNIANVVRQSPEQLYTLWAWETVSKLKLHAVDMEKAFCRGAIRGAFLTES